MNIFIMDQTNLLKTPEKSQVVAGRRGEATKSSFSDHVKRKMTIERQRNLLKSQEKQAQETVDCRRAERKKQQKEQDNEAAAIADKLNEGIKRLREYAKDKDVDGEWSLSVSDLDLLKKLAGDAGMSSAEMNQLLEQARENGNQLELVDFFDTLSRHLENFNKAPMISVPETDLPLLETFLARMGVSVDEIARMSDDSVTGDGRLDLTKFLEGLDTIQGDGSTVLSEWEAEQLQDVLGKAGVSENLQSSLFWEKDGTGRQWGDVPIVLGLGRLKGMLAQGIKDIEASRVHPDAPAFVDDLEALLSQAGLENKRGWSPVVQNSVLSAYRELLKSIDLSTGHAAQSENTLSTEFLWNQALGRADVGPVSAATAQSRFSLIRITSAIEQQILEQVSRSVIRGLQHNAHNLVLKLHPPELGEVKIHLIVRDEHVSAAFSMENTRVKELLEHNMQQFQDNLQDKGFTLGQFSVSVSHQDQAQGGNEFEFQHQAKLPGQEGSGFEGRDETVYPEDVMGQYDGHINLMV